MEGWVLKGIDYSETSRIVTLWTREKGKMRALAKGARRLKSPFENSLDLLNLCHFQIIHKGGNALDLITESQVRESYKGLRDHLPNLYAAYHVSELLSEGTEDLDPHPELFEGVHETLNRLSTEQKEARLPNRLSPNSSWQLIQFEFFYLSQIGYFPNFNHCQSCGQIPSPNAPPWIFHADSGEITCDGCREKPATQITQFSRSTQITKMRSSPLPPSSMAISPDALDVAGRLGNREIRTEVPVDKIRRELRALLNQYLTWLRGRRPKLLGFLGS